MEIGLPDEPVVHKKELFPVFSSGMFGFPYKSTDFNDGCFGFKGDQIRIDSFAEYADNALPQVGGFQL